MKLLRSLPLVFGFALVCAADAHATAQNDRPVDIELKQVDVRDVLQVLAGARDQKAVIDPCVQGKVDIRLKNTPVSVVLGALSAKLALVYEDRPKELVVSCADPGAAALDERRVTVAVKDVGADAVVRLVAEQAGLAGVDYRTEHRPAITMSLDNVRLRTVLAVLEDAGLHIRLEKNRLVIVD